MTLNQDRNGNSRRSHQVVAFDPFLASALLSDYEGDSAVEKVKLLYTHACEFYGESSRARGGYRAALLKQAQYSLKLACDLIWPHSSEQLQTASVDKVVKEAPLDLHDMAAQILWRLGDRERFANRNPSGAFAYFERALGIEPRFYEAVKDLTRVCSDCVRDAIRNVIDPETKSERISYFVGTTIKLLNRFMQEGLQITDTNYPQEFENPSDPNWQLAIWALENSASLCTSRAIYLRNVSRVDSERREESNSLLSLGMRHAKLGISLFGLPYEPAQLLSRFKEKTFFSDLAVFSSEDKTGLLRLVNSLCTAHRLDGNLEGAVYAYSAAEILIEPLSYETELSRMRDAVQKNREELFRQDSKKVNAILYKLRKESNAGRDNNLPEASPDSQVSPPELAEPQQPSRETPFKLHNVLEHLVIKGVWSDIVLSARIISPISGAVQTVLAEAEQFAAHGISIQGISKQTVSKGSKKRGRRNADPLLEISNFKGPALSFLDNLATLKLLGNSAAKVYLDCYLLPKFEKEYLRLNSATDLDLGIRMFNEMATVERISEIPKENRTAWDRMKKRVQSEIEDVVRRLGLKELKPQLESHYQSMSSKILPLV